MVLHRRTCPWCGSKDIWPEGTLVYQLLEVRVAAQPLVDETKRQVRKAAQNLGRAIRAWRERR